MQIRIVYKDNLTDESKQLCDKYWLRQPGQDTKFIHTVTALASESGLGFYFFKDCIEEICHSVVEDCHCVDCGIKYICHDRDSLKYLDIESWQCGDCFQKSQKQEIEKLEALYNKLEQARLENLRLITPVLKTRIAKQLISIPKVEELDTIDKILLVATAKEFLEEHFQPTYHFTTYTDGCFEPDFTPTSYLDIQVLEHLLETNVLLFNFDRNIESLRFGENGQLRLNNAYAGFDLAYDKQGIKQIEEDIKQHKCTIEDIENPKFEGWVKSIQIARCVANLVDGLPNSGIGYHIGDNVRDLFKNALDTYSVTQMIYLNSIAIMHVGDSELHKTLTASESDYRISHGIAYLLDLCRRCYFIDYPIPEVQHETAVEKTLSKYLFARLNIYNYTYPEITEKIRKRAKKKPTKFRIL